MPNLMLDNEPTFWYILTNTKSDYACFAADWLYVKFSQNIIVDITCIILGMK